MLKDIKNLFLNMCAILLMAVFIVIGVAAGILLMPVLGLIVLYSAIKEMLTWKRKLAPRPFTSVRFEPASRVQPVGTLQKFRIRVIESVQGLSNRWYYYLHRDRFGSFQ